MGQRYGLPDIVDTSDGATITSFYPTTALIIVLCQGSVLMDDEVTQLARQLLDSGLTSLSQREQRVIGHIAKRLHMARDVNRVLEEQQTFGERLADRVAHLGGSWAFITVFTGMLIAWVVVNTAILARFGGGFDPYPYIFST